MLGYGCARLSNEDGFWLIGPLFAEKFEIANIILESILNLFPEKETFQINIPSCNPNAVKLVNGMEFVGQCARMYNKGIPEKPNILKVYAPTSLQLG